MAGSLPEATIPAGPAAGQPRVGTGLLATATACLIAVAMMGLLVFASVPPGQLLDAQGEAWTVGAL